MVSPRLKSTHPVKQTVSKRRHTKFKREPVIWTRREKWSVVLVTLIIFTICLGIVATSFKTRRVLTQANQIDHRSKRIQEDNDSLRHRIRERTDIDRLKAFAKEQEMDQDPNRIKNIYR